MTILNKREGIILLLGDLCFFFISLFLALLFRFGNIPTLATLGEHVPAFAILSVFWIIVYYIAGLYDKHLLVLKSRLPLEISNAQVVNSIISVVFFYLVPIFGIAPKTILFIYLGISYIAILSWRIFISRFFVRATAEPALLIGSGEEIETLYKTVNSSKSYNFHFAHFVNLDSTHSDINEFEVEKKILRSVHNENIKLVAIDFSHKKIPPLFPHLYSLMYENVQFVDADQMYEEVFDRIPLSLVTYEWFLANISLTPKFSYEILKRIMDIAIALPLGIISLIFYPFVWLAIKIDDKGKIFIYQERIGTKNKPMQIVKFRTMSVDDGGVGDDDRKMKITRVGKYLRMSRIDELPQLWNVVYGNISLIGPRPELPNLVSLYEKEISFYGVRHLIKPGLSGWAQLYQKAPPKFSTDYESTRTKLSYDLYYIKNRSFILDLKIALKTVKTLLSRSGV